jgi:hypothetical protein
VTITLLEREYYELWHNSHVLELEPFETVEKCPDQLGSGYQRWIFLNGIDLLIHDYEFCDNLAIVQEEDPGCIEFGFQVLGNCQYRDRTRHGGQNFVEWDAMQLRGVDTRRFIRKLGHIAETTIEEITIAIAVVIEYQ